jgi:hypothetical protein
LTHICTSSHHILQFTTRTNRYTSQSKNFFGVLDEDSGDETPKAKTTVAAKKKATVATTTAPGDAGKER